MRLRCSLAFLFLVALTPTARAVLPPSRSMLDRPVVVPIEIVGSGHIALRAKVNGHGPYRFIFDTGAPTLLISERVGKAAGILPVAFEKPFFAPMGNLGEFVVRSINVGGARQAGLVADVWNHPTVELLGRQFGPFEGLMGFPFFAHYVVTLDYKARTLTLVPSRFVPQDTKVKMTTRLSGQIKAKTWTAGQTIGLRVTRSAKDPRPGVTVTEVLANSPAAAAGFKVGDRLLVLDGRWTDAPEDCYDAASAMDAGPVTVKLLRDGKPLTFMMTVVPGI